jgi:hypothetical protein
MSPVSRLSHRQIRRHHLGLRPSPADHSSDDNNAPYLMQLLALVKWLQHAEEIG